MNPPGIPEHYILGGFCEVKSEQFRFEAWSRSKLTDTEVLEAFQSWLSRQPHGRIPEKGLLIRLTWQGDLIR
jgi:hypothetical protein